MEKFIPVLITTEHRGVWYAEISESADLTSPVLTNLKNCKMAIYWGTSKGLHQLCHTGPTESSRISSPADILALPKVTGVFSITENAKASWDKY